MKKIILFTLIAVFTFASCLKDAEEKSYYNADVTINNVKTEFTYMVFYNTGSGESLAYVISNNGEEENAISIYLENPILGNINFNFDNNIILHIGSKIYYSKSDGGQFIVTEMSSAFISGNFTGIFEDESNNEISISGNFTSQKISY